MVEKKLCWGIPEGMAPEEAVTFGVGLVTAAFVSVSRLMKVAADNKALYQDQGVPQSANVISGEKWASLSSPHLSICHTK